MKRLGTILAFVLTNPLLLVAQQVQFDEYFLDKTMRVDYYHVGNKTEEEIILDEIYEQGPWAGNPRHLIYPFRYGRYLVKVYDIASNTLIYSSGYDGYYSEYKTTEPANKGVKRIFHQSALIPYPKRPVLFVIEKRDSMNLYHPEYQLRIEPGDYHIVKESLGRGDRVYEIVKNGSPHDNADLVIISEGYTSAERNKFELDLKKYVDIFFSWEPYKSYKTKFNISGIFTASPESGVDEPRQGSYRHTVLDATFNSMDSDRYLLTERNKTMRDIAAQVPYDAILIMVNSKRYGGGAMCNCFSTFTSDGPWSEYVFLHEFGHAFAFLGDEYYTSDVAYVNFFPQGVEPTEPNLTALLDPNDLKWKDLVTPGLPIPTPWGQQRYDSMSVAMAQMTKEKAQTLTELKKNGASEKEIVNAGKEFDRRLENVRDELRRFMEDHPLRGKIGAFEGGGFVPSGLYRPTVNSLMHQYLAKDRSYYKVNEQAIIRVIDYYSGK